MTAKPLTQSVIADRFGVSLSTVSTWLTRYGPDSPLPFPTPDSPEGITPYWWHSRWPEIEEWRRKAGGRRSRKAWPPAGYLTASGIGVWIGRSGTWIGRALNCDLKTQATDLPPFPKPDMVIKRREIAVPLWSAFQRGEVEAWHATYLAALPRKNRWRKLVAPVAPEQIRLGTASIPPAVYWVPDGDDAGLYIWTPHTQRWVWIEADASGCSTSLAAVLPQGAVAMVTVTDVGHVLDFYRDQLPSAVRPGHDEHTAARGDAMVELIEAIDLPLVAPSPRKESDLTMADLRRAYDC
jgi:hypothetical protein